MKPSALIKVLIVISVFLTPFLSAASYYDTADIQSRIVAEAKRQNMPPSLALAIAKVESNFNSHALSGAGARGVMQIMPRTAEHVFGVPRSRLFEPDVNITLGVKFIKKLLERYDGRLDIALSHYNGGSGVKNRLGEFRVIPATRLYVDKVLANQQDFLHYDNLENNRAEQQIRALRAIRLHNITRNYKSKKALTLPDTPVNVIKNTTVSAKIIKVRQWESIYLD